MNSTWDDAYKQMWEDRYQSKKYAYGERPNEFFAEQLEKLAPGAILMPADGEGRNGVFAAKTSWNVTSFDLSAAGKIKALELATSQQVHLEYLVGDLEALNFTPQSFDAIGLIYAHFAGDKKSIFHQKLQKYLKSGGYVIFEAFSKNHLPLVLENPKVGGPKDIDQLFDLMEVAADFKDYKFQVLEEAAITLNEGEYHIGKGIVIRVMAQKPLTEVR